MATAHAVMRDLRSGEAGEMTMKMNWIAQTLCGLTDLWQWPTMRLRARGRRLSLSWFLVLAMFTQMTVAPIATAAARGALPLSPAKASSVSVSRPIEPARAAQANSIIVFGPRRFDQLPGPPRNVTEQFT